MSTKLHGITLEDLNLNTTVRSFVPTVLTPTLTKSHSIRTASAMVVMNSTSNSIVGNFKLYICPITYPLQSVLAHGHTLDFTVPLYLACNIASFCNSSNVLRYVHFSGIIMGLR